MVESVVDVLGDAGINCESFVDQLRAARRRLATDRQRGLLDVVIEHSQAELVDFDIDRLMATMVDEPRHEFFGWPGKEDLVGYQAVRDYYLRGFGAGPGRGAMDLHRLHVSDDAVVKEGVVWYSAPGMANRAPELAAVVDLSRPCVLRKRMCLVMPFEGGRIVTEAHYFDGPYGIDDLVYLDE